MKVQKDRLITTNSKNNSLEELNQSKLAKTAVAKTAATSLSSLAMIDSE